MDHQQLNLQFPSWRPDLNTPEKRNGQPVHQEQGVLTKV